MVCYCPNGSGQFEHRNQERSDTSWGKVHPLLVTPEFMKREAAVRRFAECHVFTDAAARHVAKREDGPLDGDELLSIAWEPQPSAAHSGKNKPPGEVQRSSPSA